MLKPIIIGTMLASTVMSEVVQAARNDSLNLYCSAHKRHCAEMATAFQQATGITVDLTHLHPMEALRRIQAESSEPRGDVWWGGAYLVHLEAAAKNLTQEYEPQRLWQLHSWAVSAAQRSRYRAFPVHAMPQRFAVDQAKFPFPQDAPSCWRNVIAPSLDARVEVGLTVGSTVALGAITPLAALLGENLAIDIVHRHRNTHHRGATRFGDHQDTSHGPHVSLLLDDTQDPRRKQGRWTIVVPCEGQSFAMSAVSIIRGTYNFTGAEAWIDWSLSAEGQAVSRKSDLTLVPSHRSVPVPADEIDKADLFLNGQPFAEALSEGSQGRMRTLLELSFDRRGESPLK